MINAEDVRPQKWSDFIVLFDNDTYSAIWGRYEESERPCLGVRWNGGNEDNGYPNQGGNPLWYVEPTFVTESILRSMISELVRTDLDNREEYIRRTREALREFTQA